MTITLSSVMDGLIIMLSDSVITNDYGEHEEYNTGRKFCVFPGAGCVTPWGRQSGNRIEDFLERQQEISVRNHSVENLKDITYHHLRDIFRPHEYEDPEDVGYHVGGFDSQGNSRLYHLFWGRNRPSSPGELPDYHDYDHSDWAFLYNGRNVLADSVVNKYLDQVKTGQPTRYDIHTTIGRVRFCDFVGRFAAEMTPQVGPPLIMHQIFPNNQVERIVNPSLSPIEIEERIMGILESHSK